ncbi:MAG: hypothetical protein ACRDUY_10840 [Nitriliruptorales bacterium]
MRRTRRPRFETWHARGAGRVRRRTPLFMLVGLLASAVLPLVPGTHAAAQEEPEPTGLEIEKEAWFNNPEARALPDILVEEFPPGVLCIVAPGFCGEDAQQVTGIVDENRPKKEEAPALPVQPVAPDSLPTSRHGGVDKYTSAFKFKLPPTPEGQELGRFTLVLHETGPSFAIDSPATRQAVLAALVGIQTEDPAAALAEMQKIFENPDTYPPVDTALMQVQACLVTSEFKEGGGQHYDDRPAEDCVFGSTGERQEDGSWHFDVTLMAQAIERGELTNEGVHISPLSAANFAFGDPDTTDNAQTSFSGANTDTPPVALIEYVPAVGDDAFSLAPPPALNEGGQGGTSSGQDFFSGAPEFEEGTAPAPEVAPGGGATAPGPAVGQPQPVAFAPEATVATPWWVWLSVPAGLGLMFLMARALTLEPAMATERAGAMTRLMERRRQEGVLARPLAQV